MFALAVVVFVSLYFVNAGYGKFRGKGWGPTVPNRLGWVVMELPALVPLAVALLHLPQGTGWMQLVPALLYGAHYVYRSAVFPLLLRGRSRMPLTIAAMGAVFNTVNSTLIAHYTLAAPAGAAPLLGVWLPGLALFALGFGIHFVADRRVRLLRQPGDTRHYLPQGGMSDLVTSANYLGELIEWTGFALMVQNAAGWMFVVWTAANLVPRAHATHRKYRQEFGPQAVGQRKRIFPFIY